MATTHLALVRVHCFVLLPLGFVVKANSVEMGPYWDQLKCANSGKGGY